MSSIRRWYWAVSCDNTVFDPFVGDLGDLGQEDGDFSACKLITKWPDDAWVRASSAESDGEPDDVLQTLFALPIFSCRLRSALDQHRITGVQYLPLRVIGFDGREIDGFTVANILNCVDGLDLSRSKYGVFPADYFLAACQGQVRSIEKPVLIRTALQDFDIVRLEPYKPPIYVSERFVQVFEHGGFTGYSFHEIETSA
jgi:hypothetical protein